MDTLIYLVIIILIGSFLYISKKELESFNSIYSRTLRDHSRSLGGIINARPILTVAKHVRLNKFNQIDGITVKPPLPSEGELDCHVVSCPSVLSSDAICWICS